MTDANSEERKEVSFEERIKNLEMQVSNLVGIVGILHEEMVDSKEAFEHTEDSLQNLRYAVSAIRDAVFDAKYQLYDK